MTKAGVIAHRDKMFDHEAAVDIALHSGARPIDVEAVNGEHFAMMGGAGFDALMIEDADDNELKHKHKYGRVGHVRTTIRSTRMIRSASSACVQPRCSRASLTAAPRSRAVRTIILSACVDILVMSTIDDITPKPDNSRLEGRVVPERSDCDAV